MKNTLLKFIRKFKNSFAIILGIPFLFGCVFASDDCMKGQDLMRCIFNPAVSSDTIIDMGESVSTVGSTVFGGGGSLDISVNIDKNPDTKFIEAGTNTQQSVIVKITKFLLSIVIAISVTMILWNGIKYIIETGNGKESKDLVSNLIYIVVGILLALFSVTIIRIMQSVGTTLNEELGSTSTNEVFQK